MKIKYLEIKNYKQFKDLTLDLAYPQGHPKEGQPLDKICIIGQSGTGKTNLLEVVRERFSNDNVKTIFLNEENKVDEKIYFYAQEIDFRDQEFPKYVVPIDSTAWFVLRTKISNYANERLNYVDKLSRKILTLDDYTKDDFIKEMQEWEDKNDNILDKISDKLNSIIDKFNLELIKATELIFSFNDLTIKDLSNGNIINYRNLSTGTKNLISTFIPFKIHNPKDSILLIDEPENSFYPDIQRQLTELYMEVGENNQLIMATHSPLIASSFEPWEVVELKFDKNNQIYREQYYEGENHVDNYVIDPRMLTWTGILTDIFDLKEDSNFTFREKKLMEYASLKAEIKMIENPEEKEEKFNELMKLSKLLGLSN